jgi:hypothetical protein
LHGRRQSLHDLYIGRPTLYAFYMHDDVRFDDATNAGHAMIDLAFIAVIAGFFAVSVGLVAFCARLLPSGDRS